MSELIMTVFSVSFTREEHPHAGGLGGGQEDGERKEGEGSLHPSEVRSQHGQWDERPPELRQEDVT